MALRVRGPRRRGDVNRGGNVELLEEIRRLQARLEAIEMNRQRDPDIADVSENEEEPIAEEIKIVAELVEIRLLKSVIGASMRPNIDVPTYHGDLDANELIYWINEMDKFFDYDETDEEKKVKFVVTRLKDHATLWWNGAN